MRIDEARSHHEAARVDPAVRGVPGGVAHFGDLSVPDRHVGDATGRGKPVLLLDAPTTRIGRDPGNDLVIPSDTVSSFHATLDYRDGYFYIEDQRSTNGTWLSGRRLFPTRPARLKSGDVIDVAGHEFHFVIPDHEPRGRTQVLDVTSLTGRGSSAAAAPAVDTEVDSTASVVTA